METLLRTHFGVMAATDFFSMEVLTLGGLVRHVVWFVIDLESRRAHICAFPKSECLDKLIPLGERHVRLAISEFIEHYHRDRNTKGLDNRLITAVAAPVNDNASPARPSSANASVAS